MKRTIQTLIMLFCSVWAFAQTNEYLILEQADGTVQKLNINDVVRITFESDGEDGPTIDESFIPSAEYFIGVWNGEYEGWDVRQQTNCKIKKELTLYPDGTYTNNLQGALGSKTEFVDFEREAGIYSYNSQTLMVTFTVLTDSLLDFRTHQLIRNNKGSYEEKAQFSYLLDGHRKWYFQDKDLKSIDDEKTPVMYYLTRTGDSYVPNKGTLEYPYTASEANAYAASLKANEQTEDYVYVKGFISEITEVSLTYGNATYYIADSQSSGNAFYIYRGRYLQNEAFTNENQIKVGDEVILYARLTNYRGTLPETVTGECYIYSLNGKTEIEKPLELYNEPYLVWGASVDDVKSAMQDYTLVGESNDDGFIYLIYSGKLQELYTAYGIDAKRNLVSAIIAIDFSNTTAAYLNETIQKKYTYVYEADGKKMYMSEDGETVVFLSESNGNFIISYYNVDYLLADDDVVYYEEPYANWDATPDAVKREMETRDYTLYDDGTNSSGLRYLAYLGKNKETTSLYRFNAQQILAEIDIAFYDVTVEELEGFVTSKWGYIFAGNGSDGEDVYATPDNNSYVFIYSSTHSDGSNVTYVAYIKRTAASARSLVREQDAKQISLGPTTCENFSDNLLVLKLYKHFKARNSKETFMR